MSRFPMSRFPMTHFHDEPDRLDRAPLARSDRRLWLLLLLLLIVAALLRVLPLRHEALSGDELFSMRMATESAAQSWEDIRQDLVHPPLYYYLLRAFTGMVGPGMLGVRVLSLLAGLATLPLLVLLGRVLPGARWCGLIAAACVAVGRPDVYYSQEARSYAVYTAVVLLLALWLSGLAAARAAKPLFWAAGLLLMLTLAYLHYVGGLFVAIAVLAVLLSRLPLRTRLLTLGCGVCTLAALLPWLIGEAAVYRARQGVGANLDWQGHPSLYDLRQALANAVGVGEFRGATAIALCVLLLLTAAALWTTRDRLRSSPPLLGIVCMGWLTPLVVFILSVRPANLPLFGLRHILPALVLLTLLCAYGLERIAERLAPHTAQKRNTILALGTAVLVLLAGIPTATALHAGTFRFPYDRVAQTTTRYAARGVNAYAPWYYGVGEPVNFYCHWQCVHPLPAAAQRPERLLLLYRHASAQERQVYRDLLNDGYTPSASAYFTDGLQTPFGTDATLLVHQPAKTP